jgi:hypothetical protein
MPYADPTVERNYKIARRLKAKSKGLCVTCLKRQARPTFTSCQHCSTLRIKSDRKRRNKTNMYHRLTRQMNTMTLGSLRMILNKAIEEGLDEKTLITVCDKKLDLRNIFR